MPPLRILIVDDHEGVRRGVRSLLSGRSDWLVCGEASDGLEGIQKTKELQPDIVVMDISMPRMDGLQATRLIRKENPQAKVLIVSQNDPEVVRLQIAEVGALGFVAKSDLVRDLLPTIERAVGLRENGDHSGEHVPEKEWLFGGGELGDLIRKHDWSRTPLGPIKTWPQSLKTSVNLMLNSQHPMWIGWGPEATFLYNDAYISVLSLAKHPSSLGRPAKEVWAEIWHVCGHLADKVFSKGEPSFANDLRLFMSRGDYLEEVFYSFSYSPIYDENGKVAGLFCPSAETTDRNLNARRLGTLSELSAKALLEKSIKRACASALATLASNPDDLPFCLLYLLDAEGKVAALEGTAHLPAGMKGVSPEKISLSEPQATLWPMNEVISSSKASIISVKELDSLPLGPAEQRVNEAIVLPVTALGQERPIGVLIAGVNPTRKLDTEHLTFFKLVADEVATAIQNARAAEDEKQRADALAEIDRVKTVFFSNVSHEFRTPLTLMLAPLEDTLAEPDSLSGEQRQRLEVAHRNSLRLLKLVNTLLDFSRIEAGRVKASFEPTELAGFTAELASVFRSAIERAGMKLIIDCPPMAESVYVDREMWEKIVFNLLSNAFKFTFSGEIEVSLRKVGNSAELSVRDSGTGIPSEELPHLFERFHRVKGAQGRTFEGSGIGLALVQELTKLHDGKVTVESVVDKGTTFTVAIPLGKAHIPAEHFGVPRGKENISDSRVFVEEVLRLVPDGVEGPAAPLPATDQKSGKRPRILLADDNADMREYVKRLLSSQYEVETAGDGEAAFEAAMQSPPDLVLTDVMMPKLDGFGLLSKLRADHSTTTVPVILLSARAGEESRVEGIAAGADDYLIKPFSARELSTRVETHIKLSHARRESEARLRQSEEELRVLQQVGATLSSELDLKNVVQVATDAGRELSEAGFGAFFYNVVDGSGEKYMLYTISGAPPEEFSKFPMPRNTCIFAPTFAGESTLRLDDVTKDARYGKSAPYYGMPPGHLPVRSYLAVPVISRSGEVIGGLFYGHPQSGVFTEKAERLVEGIAQQAAIAIDNARLFDTATKARAEAQATAERLRAATDAGRLGAWEWDIANNKVTWTDRIYEFHGLAPGTFGGTVEAFAALVHPEDLTRVQNTLNESISGKSAYEIEFRVVRPDGGIRWISTRAEVVRDEQGAAAKLVGISQDVTERKTAQEKLRESEERQRMALHASRTVAWSWDLTTGALEHSDNAPEVLGLPTNMNVSEAWTRLHPDDLKQVQSTVEKALAEVGEYSVDFRFLRDGRSEPIWLHNRGKVERDATGKAVRVSGTTTDVTENQAAQQATGLLAAIVNSSDDAIVSKNLDSIITSWNKGAERLFGYTAKEAIGKHITLIIPPELHNEEAGIIERIKSGKPIEHFETIRRRKDGKLLDISLTISPVRDSNNRIVGASKVARDITQQKQTEKFLAEQARQQRALYQLADQLHRAKELTNVYDAALDAMMTALQCSRASILLYDDAKVMQFVAWRGLSDGYRAAAAGHSPWKPTEKNAVPICMPDLEPVELDPALKTTIKNEGIRALAFIPLVSNGQLVGKFMVYFDSPRTLSEAEVELSLTIARQLAFGIDRRQSEESLRQNRERFELVGDASELGFWFCDLPFDKLTWDARVKDHFFLPPEAVVTIQTFYERIHPDDREPTRQSIDASIANKTRYDVEYRTVSPSGEQKWIHAIGRGFYDENGQPLRFDGVTLDITESKIAEQALMASEDRYRQLAERLDAEVQIRTKELQQRTNDVLRQSEQLRSLSWRLLQAQDEERRHIARELHDSAGQTLVVLSMGFSKLIQDLQKTAPDLVKDAEMSHEFVQQLSKEIRTTSYLLHPPLLDETGIGPALSWYVDGLKSRSDLEINLEVSEDLGRLPRDMELMIFRLVQECLTNIHRHSGSKSAQISVLRQPDQISIEICDQGRGISPERLTEIQSRGAGVGIRGIRERMRQFDGEMSIESDGDGTTISVTIPLPDESSTSRTGALARPAI